jgi:pyruvate dehydrogenase E2 component (dihydrolipoamide acetyltransferase)
VAEVQSSEFVDGNASPVARRVARIAGIDLTAISGSGRGGRVSKADVEAAIRASGGTPPALKGSGAPRSAPKRDDSHINATPVARRLAAQHGINLHDCRATGSRGRVCKEDVERLLGVGAATPESEDATQTAAQPIATELSSMRKVIAARLQSSKQQAPHYRVNMDVGVDALMAARAEANQATSAAKLSVNDFLIKAVACALVKVPALNVQFDGTSVTQFSHADIAVAVAIDDGLITPIIKAAEGKSLTAISNEIRQLATQAKCGTLQASQFQGGTFTISNLGMYGVTQFDAILNPPQVGILAVGGSFARLELDSDQQLCQRSYITLSLASDHRVIDGAVAASFLQALKGFIEQPTTMLL